MAKQFFTPAPTFLLIEPIEDKTSISLAQKDPETTLRGRVLAVGSDGIGEYGGQMSAPCKVGDVVSHMTIGWEKIKYLGKEYRVMMFPRVLGVWVDVKSN